MKKCKSLALISMMMLLASCSNNPSTTPSSSPTSDSTPAASDTTSTPSSTSSTSYPDIAFDVKASSKEVEVNGTVTIRAIIMVDNNKCTFTSSDESIATVERAENGYIASVRGVKVGSVTITVTPDANPNKHISVALTVVPEKPDLRTALKNIQTLNNYQLNMGDESKGQITNIKQVMFNTPEGVILTDYYGNPVVKDSSNKYIYGKLVTSDDKVVYAVKNNSSFVTTNAPIVQAHTGLLTKDNFRGFKDKTVEAFQVGELYTLDAINPEWVTDVKNADNTYLIDGETVEEDGTPTNMKGAYLETLLWKLVDYESFAKEEKLVGDNFYFDFAKKVETSISVAAFNRITVTITVDGDKSYMMEMKNIGTAKLEDDDNGIKDLFANATASEPVLGQNFEAGVTAINTNNYIRANSTFPDHKTECNFNTYFTPDYVFYDCDADFVEKYNKHLGEDATAWEDAPYGFLKKSDGIYKFTLDEGTNTVSINETKEDNTDATTTVPEFANYISQLKIFTTDLKYSFGSEEDTIWSGRNTKYYMSDSREAFTELLQYYAPEDEEEIVESTKTGVGIEMNNGVVEKVNLTMGCTPFDPKLIDSEHNYGVNYFSLAEFGNGTNNRVHSLIADLLNA